MSTNRSPSFPEFDSSLDEDALIAPETNKKAKKTDSERKVLWSSSKPQIKSPDRSILAREIVPPRLSTEPVSVLWSSSANGKVTSSSRSKQETRLPQTFFPFDMLFEEEQKEDEHQKSIKPSSDSSVRIQEVSEPALTSSKKKKKVASPIDMPSPASSMNEKEALTIKAIAAREGDIETKLQKLKEEALLEKDEDEMIITRGNVPNMNVAVMATPQSHGISGKTSAKSSQTPSPVPGLLFGLQKSPPEINSQYSIMRTPNSTTSNLAKRASSSSTKISGSGSVQLTSWWLSGGPPDFSPPSVSSWLDSTSGKKSGKSHRPSDVLLDNLRNESTNVRAFEDKLKRLVDDDIDELLSLREGTSRPSKKGRLTVL